MRGESSLVYLSKSLIGIKVEVHGRNFYFFFFFGPGEAAAATDGLTSLTSPSLCKGGFSQPRTYKKQADATKTRYQSQ